MYPLVGGNVARNVTTVGCDRAIATAAGAPFVASTVAWPNVGLAEDRLAAQRTRVLKAKEEGLLEPAG